MRETVLREIAHGEPGRFDDLTGIRLFESRQHLRVVLPAPFGPLRPTRSRSSICQLTDPSSTRSPNDFVRRKAGSRRLLAERLGRGGENARHPERLRQIAGNAEVHRFDGLSLRSRSP